MKHGAKREEKNGKDNGDKDERKMRRERKEKEEGNVTKLHKRRQRMKWRENINEDGHEHVKNTMIKK